MKKILLTLVSVLSLSAYGQRTCGTDKKMAEFFAANPEAAANRQSLKDFLVNNKSQVNRKAGVITIPVVVHVLYSNATMNISDAQIASQMKVLNDDFRKLNADFSTAVPTVFQGVAADMELAFCLATKKKNQMAQLLQVLNVNLLHQGLILMIIIINLRDYYLGIQQNI